MHRKKVNFLEKRFFLTEDLKCINVRVPLKHLQNMVTFSPLNSCSVLGPLNSWTIAHNYMVKYISWKIYIFIILKNASENGQYVYTWNKHALPFLQTYITIYAQIISVCVRWEKITYSHQVQPTTKFSKISQNPNPVFDTKGGTELRKHGQSVLII